MTGILGGLIGSYKTGPVGDFELIETVTIPDNAGIASISFSSIPSGYKHLQVRGFLRAPSTGPSGITNLSMQVNNDTSASYSFHAITGQSGSGASALSSLAASSITIARIVSGATNLNYFSPIVLDIPDAFNASKNKTFLASSGNMHDTNRLVTIRSGLYLNNSAISSLNFFLQSSTFTVDTKLSLYGIRG